MRSKNHKPATHSEQQHIQRVKELPCGVCEAPGPSDAHHIVQQQHWTVIPLCSDCHQGAFNGVHGQRRIWNVHKKTEMSVLNETVRRLCGGR